MEYTNGELLSSFSVMHFQESCRANVQNAGSWYAWTASTANGTKTGYMEENSICSKGWQLSTNTESDIRSFYYLVFHTYGVETRGGDKIYNLPLSFINAGNYYHADGRLYMRGQVYSYWSGVAYDANIAKGLYFNGLDHMATNSDSKARGFSLCCDAMAILRLRKSPN